MKDIKTSKSLGILRICFAVIILNEHSCSALVPPIVHRSVGSFQQYQSISGLSSRARIQTTSTRLYDAGLSSSLEATDEEAKTLQEQILQQQQEALNFELSKDASSINQTTLAALVEVSSSPALATTTEITTPEPESEVREIVSSSSTTTSEPEVEEAVSSNMPSYKTLVVFASTTILIWLSEPLLSLVDTTVVGLTQKNAVMQLASMGPATTLMDSLFYMTYFLAIATTNQIAPALTVKDYPRLRRITSDVFGVATALGVLITLFVWVAGRPMLRNLAGASASPELLFYATRYSFIRATSAVSSVVGGVAQSFCLSTFNTITPAIAVLAASIINVIGDLLLSPWGVQGAAVATALSSMASTGILMRAVRKQVQEWRRKENETVNGATTMSTNTTQVAGAGKNDGSFFSFPDKKSLIKLMKLSGPIFFVIVAKIACYNAMTLKCTDFGVVPLAANSILMRVFFFFACFGDSISQTAQSFMPSTIYPKLDAKSFRATIKKLLMVTGFVSVTNSKTATVVLNNLGRYLTNDQRIIRGMTENSRFIGMSLFLHPFIMLFEGTIMAQRAFPSMIAIYSVTLCLHFSILKFYCKSFPAVWRAFFFFQATRLLNFAIAVWNKQRMVDRAEKKRLEIA